MNPTVTHDYRISPHYSRMCANSFICRLLYRSCRWFILSSMERTTWVGELSDLLFWDTARNSVDPSLHLRWILERVLELGDYNDWLIVKQNIAPEQMKKELGRLRIDPKARNFLERYIHGIDNISR